MALVKEWEKELAALAPTVQVDTQAGREVGREGGLYVYIVVNHDPPITSAIYIQKMHLVGAAQLLPGAREVVAFFYQQGLPQVRDDASAARGLDLS